MVHHAQAIHSAPDSFDDPTDLQARVSHGIIENVNVWLNVLDLKLNVVLWNATAERLSGYTRDEVLGHARIWEWLYPDEAYRDSITQRTAGLLVAEQALENFETRIVCRDGVTRTILWNSKGLADEDGQVYGIITFGYDITDLERARKALQKTHNDLEVLLDVASVTSASMDLGTILNRSLTRVLQSMNCPKGMVHLRGDGNGSGNGSGNGKGALRLAAQIGLDQAVARQMEQVGDEDEIVGRVARTGEPVVLSDPTQASGMLRNLPAAMVHSYVGVPLRAKGDIVGVFSILGRAGRGFRSEEVTLLTSIGDQIGVAVVNATLYQQSQRLAVLEERRRLARDLHDSVTQTLYSLTLFAETGRRLVQRGEREAAETYLNRLIESAQRAVKEMRLLVFELRPLGLESDGLLAALEKRLDAVERRAGVRASLVADPELTIPRGVERDLYHILQEALNNAHKYSGASSVTVTLRVSADRFVAEVMDDGQGFDVEEALRRGGLGLTSMRERADRLEGALVVRAAPGRGAAVSVSFPLDKVPASIDSEEG